MFVAFSNIFSDWVKKESPSNFVNGGKKKKKSLEFRAPHGGHFDKGVTGSLWPVTL